MNQKYCELKKANMVFRPYVGGAESEQTGSNPNILKVGAHYCNGDQPGAGSISPSKQAAGERAVKFEGRELGPGEFLPNVIAVGTRVDDETSDTFTDRRGRIHYMSSYGNGLEFLYRLDKRKK